MKVQLFSIHQAPSTLPIWQSILDDLGQPHPSQIAKALVMRTPTRLAKSVDGSRDPVGATYTGTSGFGPDCRVSTDTRCVRRLSFAVAMPASQARGGQVPRSTGPSNCAGLSSGEPTPAQLRRRKLPPDHPGGGSGSQDGRADGRRGCAAGSSAPTIPSPSRRPQGSAAKRTGSWLRTVSWRTPVWSRYESHCRQRLPGDTVDIGPNDMSAKC